MLKLFLLTLTGLLSINNNYGQPDTLFNYNTETHMTYSYPPAYIDSTKTFDNTGWNFGSEPGFDLLSLEIPDTTFNNSGFTDLIPVQNLYNIYNYPARTAVKLFRIENDSLKQICSGILVARDYVLTSCHCLAKYDTNRVLIFYDSLRIYPAFDNGVENTVFGSSIGIEYITFRSNLQNFLYKDIALIKLKDAIGTKTGWTGIAFSMGNAFLNDNVFYKYSYPGVTDPFDSTRIFNGDTLYYNYGTLDLIESSWLGFNMSGIPGQSGSSLLYTNNEKYYSFGTLSMSLYSRHCRITPEIFYNFKQILDSSILYVYHQPHLVEDYYLSEAYPNPFNPVTRINFNIPVRLKVMIKIYDVLGREVRTLVNNVLESGKHNVIFNGNQLTSGIYICRMQAGKIQMTRKLLLLK